MGRKRLTRREQQARTRSKLMGAASKVFSCKGMQQGSIDEVAQEAGYTKGAFYANFKSKEELFLAMLDEHFGERIAEVERAFASDESPPEQARHAAAEFARATRADPEHDRLFLEFASYALQDPTFREELLTRFATLRSRMAEIYERRMEAYGIEPPVPTDRIVRMVIAMADGWALWRLLEPKAVDDELFESMMEIFTTGVGALAGVFDQQSAEAQKLS
jgi:AcrR family transcriptional regulator